ncbi:MAG: hypothetical protein ACLFM4_05050 [Phormidium sp.]
MTSQVPSNNHLSSNKIRSRLLLFFLLCTIGLMGYTLARQHSCNPIISWETHQQVARDKCNSNISSSSKTDSDNNTNQKVNVEEDKDDSKETSTGCSPQAAIAIGTIVTIGTTALLVPPPAAFLAGSAAATGACWLIDKVN